MEPQTIINKSYIEDSVAETGTYTSVLAIAPSMTGTDLNGPGLSDNGVKNTLRGLPDGSFGLSFDGIAFGDTNGPSHHSESYFPASTIGAIAVDRGPGNAGTLGPSTYGGTISLFSEALTSQQQRAACRPRPAAGAPACSMLNYQTGDFDMLGINSRLLLNYQDTNTSGYLTRNSSAAQNYTIKYQADLAPGWTATLFASANGLFQQLEDNAGATAAQITTFGKNYALQIDNPKAGTYAPYNHVHKKTDLDYLRLQGDLGNGFSIDNTSYTYAYVNKTLSTLTVQQTAADIRQGRHPEKRDARYHQWPLCHELSYRHSWLYQAERISRMGQYFSGRQGFRFRLAERPGSRRGVVGKLDKPARPFRLRRYAVLRAGCRALQSFQRSAISRCQQRGGR